MSNSGPQINIGEWDPKKIRRYISIAVIGIILLTFFFMAWKDVAPGEQGFVHKPYGFVCFWGAADEVRLHHFHPCARCNTSVHYQHVLH